jgi:hypothetical protein
MRHYGITVIVFQLWLFNLEAQPASQFPKPITYGNSEYNNLDSLRNTIGKRFEFICDNGIELAAYLAINYFPELKDNRIKVIYKDHNRAPIIATIDIWNFLRRRKKRIYKIIVKNNSFVGRISLNRQVGLVGHEMSHFSFYQSKSSGGLFLVAIKYMTSKKYHYSFERGADTTAIARGLGWQLLDMGIYMRRDEIRDLMKKKGYFGEGLDIGYIFRRREENDF